MVFWATRKITAYLVQSGRNDVKARQTYSPRIRLPNSYLLEYIQDKLENRQLQQPSRGVIQGGQFYTHCLLRKDILRVS
jgi:hypothetical protein